MKYILDKINEVKERVFESVMQKKKEQQLAKKKTMRQLLQTEARISDKLALGGITFF